MNIQLTSKGIRAAAATAIGIAWAAANVQAGSFGYTNSDLVLGFRVSGQPDLIVDIGQASIYEAVTAAQTISVTNLPTGLATLLNFTFPSFDSVSWSVTGAQRGTGGTYPNQTIWATAARSDVNALSVPYSRQGQFSQGGPASQIAAIGVNAAAYSSAHPGSATNNATAVLIPSTDQNSYTKAVQDPFNNSIGDLAGSFGNVENTTPFDFDSDEPLSVSDLYELQPGSGPGKFVGYFSFTPNGAVTFTAATQAPLPPTITTIARDGNVTTVYFTTQSSHTYSLLSSPTLTVPVSGWSVVGSSVSGTGSTVSLQDTNSATATYYAIATQ